MMLTTQVKASLNNYKKIKTGIEIQSEVKKKSDGKDKNK